MSGHSHWSTIKRKKEANDAQRGKIFSKLARKIVMAAREKGGDPETNSALRIAIDTARSFNMPSKNIERAVERGTGAGADTQILEEILCEGYGPGGIAVIVESITDNKNRTFNDIRQTFNKNNGKMADQGSVKWMFEQKGSITIDNEKAGLKKEDLELKAIEAGAEDIIWSDNILSIYVPVESLEKAKDNLQKQSVAIESASLDWVAKTPLELSEQDKKAAERLFEALDENDDVQEIYSNIAS